MIPRDKHTRTNSFTHSHKYIHTCKMHNTHTHKCLHSFIWLPIDVIYIPYSKIVPVCMYHDACMLIKKPDSSYICVYYLYVCLYICVHEDRYCTCVSKNKPIITHPAPPHPQCPPPLFPPAHRHTQGLHALRGGGAGVGGG